MHRLIAAVLILPVLVSANAAGGTIIASFESIPDALSANDLSPDGRYIVGETDLDGDFVADGTYVYDTVTQTMTVLPADGLNATAVSDDGATIVGEIPDPVDPDPDLGTVAAKWQASTQWQSIGYLPNALECPSRSNAYEISGDGSVVVGLSWNGCNGRGFRWTQATGMQQLQVLAFGSNRASVVSADGNVIGGFAQGTSSRTPAVWDGSLAGQTLDPTAAARGEVMGINDAGTILLGTWATTESDNRAVKWTATETGWQREMLGTGSMQPFWVGIPMDIADSGTIVGFDFRLGNRIAWILENGAPPYIALETYVTTHGGTVPPAVDLLVCQAISANGRRIIGHGPPSGAWIVTLELLGDMNCDGVVTTDDIDPFTQALLDPAGYEADFPLCTTVRANMNQDGNVDSLDIQDFVMALLGS